MPAAAAATPSATQSPVFGRSCPPVHVVSSGSTARTTGTATGTGSNGAGGVAERRSGFGGGALPVGLAVSFRIGRAGAAFGFGGGIVMLVGAVAKGRGAGGTAAAAAGSSCV